jgi:hypothetical protein
MGARLDAIFAIEEINPCSVRLDPLSLNGSAARRWQKKATHWRAATGINRRQWLS